MFSQSLKGGPELRGLSADCRYVTSRHVLLDPVCDYFTCVHVVVVFVYFTGCVFSINVSFNCRFTLNTCAI